VARATREGRRPELATEAGVYTPQHDLDRCTALTTALV